MANCSVTNCGSISTESCAECKKGFCFFHSDKLFFWEPKELEGLNYISVPVKGSNITREEEKSSRQQEHAEHQKIIADFLKKQMDRGFKAMDWGDVKSHHQGALGYYFCSDCFKKVSGNSPNTESGLSRQSQGSNSCCFVASAVYYSYGQLPKLNLLRSFRDRWLVKVYFGRAFLSFYYRVGPSIAKTITIYPPLRSIVRIVLDFMVLALGTLKNIRQFFTLS